MLPANEIFARVVPLAAELIVVTVMTPAEFDPTIVAAAPEPADDPTLMDGVPLFVMAGTLQVPSSRRYRVAPAVAPGSGTTPAAWVVPLGPNNGNLAALMVPLVTAAPLTPPVIVVAFNVPTLIVPAVNALGEKL